MSGEIRRDHVLHTIAAGCVRVFVASTKELVETAVSLHHTMPVVTAAFGRLLTGSAIMGVMQKNDEDLMTVQIKGDGPLGGMLVTAKKDGSVKGYVINPDVSLPLNAAGKLDVARCVGNGDLTVIKDMGLKEPYVGKVPIASGEVAADIAYYFAYSEQTPSVVALGVLVERDLSVRQAGGFIVQLMPGADEGIISQIEKNTGGLPPVTTMMDSGLSTRDILNMVCEGLDFDEPDVLSARYECDCSRARVEKALISIGKDELLKIIAEDHKADLSCHFCDKTYAFSEADLVSLLNEAKG